MEITQIGKQLLKNKEFISQLKKALIPQQQTMQSREAKIKPNVKLDSIISQLSGLLNQLIKQKIQLQMNEIIEDNNRILYQIKETMIANQKSFCKQKEGGHNMREEMILCSDNINDFDDIHRLITQQKNKAMGQLNDEFLQKSISAMVEFKCQNFEEKIYSLQKKVKALQQKFDTNMKSVWNVISMTEAVVFDYMTNQKTSKKQNKQGKQNKTPQQKLKVSKKMEKQKIVNTDKSEQSFFNSFWK